MSRIGKQPISVPSNVKVNIDGSSVTVTGPKGELSNSFNSEMIISERDGEISVKRPSDESQHKAFHGLTRSLIANMVTGVSDGYEKNLELVGIGYRAQQTGEGVTLSVMLSHTVLIEPPEGVTLEVLEANRIKISGIDKQAVGEIAAQIRKVRPPNAYTGKGIRYAGEYVRIKPGKSARRA
jgi:large subunit ribosomal protein L6